MTYRKDIQILGGIAVPLVVLFHLGIAGFNLIRVNSPQLAAKGPFLIGAFDTP